MEGRINIEFLVLCKICKSDLDASEDNGILYIGLCKECYEDVVKKAVDKIINQTKLGLLGKIQDMQTTINSMGFKKETEDE